MPNSHAPHGDCRPVLVLASGKGTRMGGPKALMQVAGRPWWETQCERLAEASVAPVWVVSPAVRAAMFGRMVAGSQCPPRFVEGDPDAPMIQSARRGVEFLASSRPRGVFVLPVDVPAPDAEVWRALCEASRDAAVTIPTCNGERGHPIYLPWVFAITLRSHDGSARLDHLIAPHAKMVSVSDSTIKVNLNTPEDVRVFETSLAAQV